MRNEPKRPHILASHHRTTVIAEWLEPYFDNAAVTGVHVLVRPVGALGPRTLLSVFAEQQDDRANRSAIVPPNVPFGRFGAPRRLAKVLVKEMRRHARMQTDVEVTRYTVRLDLREGRARKGTVRSVYISVRMDGKTKVEDWESRVA